MVIPDSPNLIWNFYSIIELLYRNNFPKQGHALTKVFRLLHTRKCQMFSTESNMTVKNVRYLPKSELAFRRCLQPFTGKLLSISIFLNFFKLQVYRLKLDSSTDAFLWILLNISEHFFCETRLDSDWFC